MQAFGTASGSRAWYNSDMENMLSCNVTDIPEASRRSLEDLLGRQLHANQRVCILVIDSSAVPNADQRASATAGLRELITIAQSHADQTGVSEEEIDAAVNEAMGHVRRRQTS
jgi:hypothetical protein